MTLTVATTATSPVKISGLDKVQAHVRAAGQLLGERFGITNVGGWRASAHDMTGHPAGLALDFPAGRAVGDALAAYAIANAEPLAVKYVIWQQRIWTTTTPKWVHMKSRPGDTGSGYDPNHLRHVHVSFTQAGAAAGLLDKLKTAAGAVTGLVDGSTSITDVLNPAVWGAEAQKVALRIAVVGAGLGLLLLGSWRLVAPAAQRLMDAPTNQISKVTEALT